MLIKIYLTSLVTKEVKIKITMIYHFIPTIIDKLKRHMLKIKETGNLVLWEGKILSHLESSLAVP